jgi:hypothetical protein
VGADGSGSGRVDAIGSQTRGSETYCSVEGDMCVCSDDAVFFSDDLADEWIKRDVNLSNVPAGVVRDGRNHSKHFYCNRCRAEWNHCDNCWTWCEIETRGTLNNIHNCRVGSCASEQCQAALEIHEGNPGGHKFDQE